MNRSSSRWIRHAVAVGAVGTLALSGVAFSTPATASGTVGNSRLTAVGAHTRGNEPGKSVPTAFPRTGRVSVLVALDAPSALGVYKANAARGQAAASAAARQQTDATTQKQDSVSQAAAQVAPGTVELYRTSNVLAAVALSTDASNIESLQKISGVKAIYPIVPKRASNAYSVPLVHAPQAWTAHSNTGQNSTIAIIDTGIDYTHANFGGVGTPAAYNTALKNDKKASGFVPNAKVIGGFDFAGDSYDADPTSPTYQPVPHTDKNPLDCAGHGSHVAGTAAGYGVDGAGATFAGPYNNSTPFGSLRIGPGMAPNAKLYAYKVFGCEGSTDVVGEAIDRAADPNKDGDPSDHVDVINMSLGADYASPQDGDSVASNAAADLGITVVVASGNGGDYFDVGGSPGNAVKTIAVANSIDASSIIDSVHVTAPPSIAGDYGATRSVLYDWNTQPDLTGTLAPLVTPSNLDACDPLAPADAAAVNGKVAFVEWTDDDTTRRCGSITRGNNLTTAGAVGFVFADDQETFAAGINGSTVIPGVLVTKSAGDAMRAHLGDGVVISGTTANGFPQVFPQDNDKVNTSSSRGVRNAGGLKPDVSGVGTSVFSTAMGTGTEGVSFTGTSMATPEVAGLSALVTTAHPDWNPEMVKADIMNTAGQDLFTGDNHTGTAYAPNRVGAGRIQADVALNNDVLAYVVDDPGAVSVSFGPVAVTGPMTLTKTVQVVNTASGSATYQLSYQPLTSVPGVNYLLSVSSITVPGHSSKTFTIQFQVSNANLLTKTIDPTMDLDQAGLPRNFLADASGRIVLDSVGSRPDLRLPVYSGPRPASNTTQPSSVTFSGSTANLNLTGKGVNNGSGATKVRSLVAGFELQAISPPAPPCTATVTSGCIHFPDEKAGDVKYVGSTSDADFVYFAVGTQGPWHTEASQAEYDIYIDDNGDNKPDLVVFNTRLSDQDIFVDEIVDLHTDAVLDIEAIDNVLGNTDTAEFDSDVLFMPVPIGLLHSPNLRYGIASFGDAVPSPVDIVALSLTKNGNITLKNGLKLDASAPGIVVSGTTYSAPLLVDAGNKTVTVTRNSAAYTASGGQGILLFHFHNVVGNKSQVVTIN